MRLEVAGRGGNSSVLIEVGNPKKSQIKNWKAGGVGEFWEKRNESASIWKTKTKRDKD